MRLVSFRAGGAAGWGVADGGEIVVLSEALPGVRTLREALAAGLDRIAGAMATARTRLPLEAIEFLPPIPEPGKILCIGINYMGHIIETGRQPPKVPTVFTRFADAQTGHRGRIVRPRVSTNHDYEGELALVIGAPGRYIPREKALDHVAGWTCFNDGSIRDWQNASAQFTAGKNFPASGACGPWLVTRDAAPDPSRFTLTTRVNGQVVQHAPVSDLVFDVPALIAHCSTFTPLAPGDMIVTGTPAGVGMVRNPPLWLKPGDTIEVEIDAVGTLRNEVVAEDA